ncbi:F-box/kelch-repeat protein [Cardamine amara subsp. amara]|uniref:F-box/kelch-repeat protein n=1 Tax=Cardamine amara subsp. amara TaxID=228776 RepID=A0ABD1BWK4_CARAN
MAESATEKMKKSLLECSLLLENQPHSSDSVSKLQPSPSPSPSGTKENTLSMPDWSYLPEDLLHIISKKLEDEEDCFNVIHARSVCHTWRSTFAFPSCLLRQSYSFPPIVDYQSNEFPTLEKIPLFLFRVRAVSPSFYYMGVLCQDESEDHTELPSPIQCLVKVKIPGSYPTLMKTLDCQILSMGHKYRMIDCISIDYRGMAFLPLNKEGGGGGGEFVALLNCTRGLFVFRSAEMRWMRLQQISVATCYEVATFRGRFYAVFLNGDIFVIDPHSLEVTPLRHSQPLISFNHLFPSGNDELFLLEKIIPDILRTDRGRLTCRVSRLNKEAGEWVVVSDLGDRVLFIGEQGNLCCSAKVLPDGCGVSGNSILFTNSPGNVIYFYKYGVHTEYAEGDLNFWRYSREYGVRVLYKSPPLVALQIERNSPV